MKKLICFLLICLFYYFTTYGQTRLLEIDPVYQKTPVWCWVSIGEMIFKYHDICSINPFNDYQCGIIALMGPTCNENCYDCQVPAGRSVVIQNMLQEYPKFASQYCGQGKFSIHSTILNYPVTADVIVKEINNYRPIIAGISPSGNYGMEPAHVALIIGYEYIGYNLFLLVNDPFPYEAFSYSIDPYIAAGGTFIKSGQYLIGYYHFFKLNWNNTFINIE